MYKYLLLDIDDTLIEYDYLTSYAFNQMLKKFKELTEKSCEKEMEYVKCYGPLEVMDNESINKLCNNFFSSIYQ